MPIAEVKRVTRVASMAKSKTPIKGIRKHNSAFGWLVGGVFLTVGSILAFLFLTLLSDLGGPEGFVIGGLLAVAPVPLYVGLASWLDRFEKEPLWLMGVAFFWGAVFSVFFSFAFNRINEQLVEAFMGRSAAATAGTLASAPFVEEVFKGFVLLVLFLWKRNEFDGIVDGIIYASMVGLGFAMTENALYYGQEMAEKGFEGSKATFLLRGVFAPFSHPMFTAMFGIGLGVARQSEKRWAHLIAPILGFLGAMAMHFLWNYSASGRLFFAGYFLVMVPSFCGVIILVGTSLKREGSVIREELSSEINQGLLTADEAAMLCSVTGRIGWDFRVMRQKGPGALRKLHRFQQLCSELAFHRRRVERSIVGREASLYAAEARMLDDIWDLRQAL